MNLIQLDNNTLAVDLSKSWSANTVSAVSTPSDDLNVVTRQPTLWYNGFKNKLNLYGGWPYSEDPEPVLVSSATPKRGNVTWSNEFQKGDGSSFSKVTRKFAGLAASSPTAYYNLGGRASSLTDSDFGTYNGWFAMNDLLIFDFATGKSLSWSKTHRLIRKLNVISNLYIFDSMLLSNFCNN